MPPSPDAAELEVLARRLESADPVESEVLLGLFGDEPDLLAYAVRDSDGDGVHDFRVSDYYGRFLEGDVDLDGDGVRNTLDSDPYDPARGGVDADGDGAPDPGSFPDRNANTLPDHVDWELEGRRPEIARYQRDLYTGYGILLVERSAPFPSELARTVYDVTTRVLREPFAGGLPTLRVVASEDVCLLTPELDDGTNAMAVPQTQSLLVYQVGIEAPPFVQLGLLTHEMAHSYQFSLDFEGVEAENARFVYRAPRFHEQVRAFGWSYEPAPQDAEAYALFTPHYYGIEPEYAFRGRSPEAWSEWLLERAEEAEGEILAEPSVVEAGVVSEYSLQDPWEWHSDNLLAYLYVEIEAAVLRSSGEPSERARAVGRMRAASREAWPDFRYANLAPGVRMGLREALPLRPEDLEAFVATYVALLPRPD